MAKTDTLTDWLATLDPGALAEVLRLRPDAASPPPRSLAALADRLSIPHSVERALDQLDRAAVDLLGALQQFGERATVAGLTGRLGAGADPTTVDRAMGELTRRALAWPAYDLTVRLAGPLRPTRADARRLGTAGGQKRAPTVHPAPPAPRLADTDPRATDEFAGIAALATVAGVTRLIEHCSATPPAMLRTGGVGVQELRRLAKALATTADRVRLWLALADAAGLVAADDGAILPTRAADAWLAAEPADRLAPLVLAWWHQPVAATFTEGSEKPPPALGYPASTVHRELRHELLARWPADRALAEPAELVAELAWRRPLAYGDGDALGPLAAATTAEAASLGVLVGGSLSSWGRSLVASSAAGVSGGSAGSGGAGSGGAGSGSTGTDTAGIAEAARRVLPAASGTARLQADLTAVVAGVPSAGLAALLDLAADATERDTASVWRFSPASVRRAFDAGHTADLLLAELGEIARDDLPQPLAYLVRDVARRHGEVGVFPVGCCVRSDDTALLRELAVHRGLAELKPRMLAPTVLSSVKSTTDTVALLRRHGYAPVAHTGSGAPVVERRTPRRARGSAADRRAAWTAAATAFGGPTELGTEERRALATDLLTGGEPDPGAGWPSTTRRLLDGHTPWLSSGEVDLLVHAIDTETPVAIDYVSQVGRSTRRVITPIAHHLGYLEAWCHLRDDERNFLVSRIHSVSPA